MTTALFGVHSELAPEKKYQSVLEPEYVFDPKGVIAARHAAKIPEDDGGPITFKWHFPAGTLRPRMSGLELAEFLKPHCASILATRLLSGCLRVEREFARIWLLFETTPDAALDEILPWVQAVDRRVPRRTADKLGIARVEWDDIIVLDLNCRYVPDRVKKIFY